MDSGPNAASGKVFPTHNPATGEKIADVAEADAAEVDDAVAAARRAFDSGPWPRMDAAARGRLLLQVAEKLRARGDELARMETLDNGKAIRETRAQVNASADYFEYYGGWADKLEGHVVPVRGRFHTYTVLEPIGVLWPDHSMEFAAAPGGAEAGPRAGRGLHHDPQACRTYAGYCAGSG